MHGQRNRRPDLGTSFGERAILHLQEHFREPLGAFDSCNLTRDLLPDLDQMSLVELAIIAFGSLSTSSFKVYQELCECAGIPLSVGKTSQLVPKQSAMLNLSSTLVDHHTQTQMS